MTYLSIDDYYYRHGTRYRKVPKRNKTVSARQHRIIRKAIKRYIVEKVKSQSQ
jgi:hypothetical protein